MNSKEANDIRCIAHEIILRLHKHKQIGQIQLLHMACLLAHKDLDRDSYAKWTEEHHSAPKSDAMKGGGE